MLKNIKELFLRSLSLMAITAGVAVISLCALTVAAVETDLYWFDGMYCSAAYSTLTRLVPYSIDGAAATSNRTEKTLPAPTVAPVAEIAPIPPIPPVAEVTQGNEVIVITEEPGDTAVAYTIEFSSSDSDTVVYEINPREIESGIREAAYDISYGVQTTIDKLRQAWSDARHR